MTARPTVWLPVVLVLLGLFSLLFLAWMHSQAMRKISEVLDQQPAFRAHTTASLARLEQVLGIPTPTPTASAQ